MEEVYYFPGKRHSGVLDTAISSTSLRVMHLLRLHPTIAGTQSWNVRLLHTRLELPSAIYFYASDPGFVLIPNHYTRTKRSMNHQPEYYCHRKHLAGMFLPLAA